MTDLTDADRQQIDNHLLFAVEAIATQCSKLPKKKKRKGWNKFDIADKVLEACRRGIELYDDRKVAIKFLGGTMGLLQLVAPPGCKAAVEEIREAIQRLGG